MTSAPDTIEDLIAQLSADAGADPTREAIASELGVLQSIYGEDAVSIWTPPSRASSKSPSPSPPDHGPSLSAKNTEPGTIRYEVILSIDCPSSPQPIHANILVSLPPTYPTSAPPQLQLLSRYIGPYGVDAALFGSVLRTYISRGAVEWVGAECVFDGLEWVRERCAVWVGERTSERVAGEMVREDGREHAKGHEEEVHAHTGGNDGGGGMVRAAAVVEAEAEAAALPAEMPPGITIVEAEPIQDRKSAFVGRACRVTDPSQVPIILAHLTADRRISRAAHPVINAWRCRVGSILHQDNDDDGETAAGGRLAHLLQILEVENVLVIVTRYFGGIHLGPDRFKHINQAARNALELGGFLDVPDDDRDHDRGGSGRKHGKGGRTNAKR